MKIMFSYNKFNAGVALKTTLVLLFVGTMAYLSWRFQIKESRLQLNIEDRAQGVEQQIEVAQEPGKQPDVEVKQLPKFKLVSLKKMAIFGPAEIDAAKTSYLSDKPVTSLVTRIEKYRLHYEIEDEKGEFLPVEASVYVPTSRNKDRPWFVFAAGTSGLDDMCAPSREKVTKSNIGNYENQMISHASEDMIVIFPDYVGFNDHERLQPYFIAEMEARVLLGAAATFDAAIENEPEIQAVISEANKDVFFSGYSQGGHAALSAASRRTLLPPNLTVKGVVAYASAGDVEALLSESPRLGPYILRSYDEYYGDINEKLFLQEKWLTHYQHATQTVCIDHIGKSFANSIDKLYTPEFAQALRSKTIAKFSPELQKHLQENMTFDQLEDVPVFLLQGATDPIVTASTQHLQKKKLCQLGAHVSYKEYPGANHYHTRQVGFMDSVQWMNKVSEDIIPTSHCSR